MIFFFVGLNFHLPALRSYAFAYLRRAHLQFL